MKVVFSDHALERMARRQISERAVLLAIKNPDRVLLQEDYKKQALKIVKRGQKKYLLVVVYREINSTKRVVTVFLTSKIKKYLN